MILPAHFHRLPCVFLGGMEPVRLTRFDDHLTFDVPRLSAPQPVNRPLSLSPRHEAFTLIEISVAGAIVIILAVVAVPVYSRINQGARAAACMSNLRQIGTAVHLYLNEHDRTMPTLKAGRSDKTEEGPVIDNTLSGYVQNPAVFACPADYEGLAKKTGTSYYWNIILSGQKLSNLNFLRKTEWQIIPMLSDKDPFHPYTDTKVNILYADGHADKEINFVSASPTPPVAP